MKAFFVSKYVQNIQKQAYGKFNSFAKSSPLLGRLGAFPVAVLDIGVHSLSYSLHALEALAVAVVNLSGLIFATSYSNKCSLKDALFNTEMFMSGIILTPFKLLIAPLKVIYQVSAIIINSEKVNPFDYNQPTFQKK